MKVILLIYSGVLSVFFFAYKRSELSMRAFYRHFPSLLTTTTVHLCVSSLLSIFTRRHVRLFPTNHQGWLRTELVDHWRYSDAIGAPPPFEIPTPIASMSWRHMATLTTIFLLSFASLFVWAFLFPSAFGVVLLLAAFSSILVSVDKVLQHWWLLAIYVTAILLVEYFWAIRDSGLWDKVSGHRRLG